MIPYLSALLIHMQLRSSKIDRVAQFARMACLSLHPDASGYGRRISVLHNLSFLIEVGIASSSTMSKLKTDHLLPAFGDLPVSSFANEMWSSRARMAFMKEMMRLIGYESVGFLPALLLIT